jgi:hypothetical protein
MFRLVTAQLIESGACRQVDIIRRFGVPKRNVIRAVKKLRQEGVEGFFKPRPVRQGGTILTSPVLAKAQSLLDEDYSRTEIAKILGVKYDTLRKAICDGRLKEPKTKASITTKSSRDTIDTKTADQLGTACTRVDERLEAAFGKSGGAIIRFDPCLDVPKGGVLSALPALLANGLLHGAQSLLGEVKGYYRTVHVLLLLAFMSLCRIKTVEQLRGHAPGEFGKLIGLDRVPEVRCLRKKLDQLSLDDAAEKWSAHLGQHWMQADPAAAGTLYVDGHVRVYHGKKTKLPRKYVSRDRLCLRGVCDYWVNDAVGNPFFVVEKTVDPGMLKTLEGDIIPRLLHDVPDQPGLEELRANPHLSRITIVFDREGYSPGFFKRMWREHRISCLTYHKFPGNAWPEEWFVEHGVTMPQGETVTMRLAEMGSLVGSGKDAIWLREVRKLTDSGHQTSLISTAYGPPHLHLAAQMFSRWCQENFFGYMMRHFAIDMLAEYGVEDLPANVKVIHPTWRDLTKKKNSLLSKLRYRQARFAAMTIHPKTEEDARRYRDWVQRKADLLEEIQHIEHDIGEIKAKLKQTSHYITWEDLGDNEKFKQLVPGRKHLLDTVKMIAYRAETAMADMLIGPAVDTPKARRLLQDLFMMEADILPDAENKLLRIRVHSASRPAANKSLQSLFEQLNETEQIYPATDMRVVYELGGTIC